METSGGTAGIILARGSFVKFHSRVQPLWRSFTRESRRRGARDDDSSFFIYLTTRASNVLDEESLNIGLHFVQPLVVTYIRACKSSTFANTCTDGNILHTSETLKQSESYRNAIRHIFISVFLFIIPYNTLTVRQIQRNPRKVPICFWFHQLLERIILR